MSGHPVPAIPDAGLALGASTGGSAAYSSAGAPLAGGAQASEPLAGAPPAGLAPPAGGLGEAAGEPSAPDATPRPWSLRDGVHVDVPFPSSSGAATAGTSVPQGAGQGAALPAVYAPAPLAPYSRDVPLDEMDPTGVRDVSDRIVREDRRVLDEEAEKGDPQDLEGQTFTADPFDTQATFSLDKYLRMQREEQHARGNEIPEMGLAFRGLRVTGYGTGAKFGQSVGTMLTSPLRAMSGIRELLHPKVKVILDDIDGCVKPGEMLLVLGRPGSGSTTLLKSLASYRDGYRSIEGDVRYEGMEHKVIDGPLRGEVVYAPEDDVHFATLSVKNTLDFAAATRTPRASHRVTLTERHTRKEFITLTVEAIATILGLRKTYNTYVGNSMVRGVSGGERKRVSIGEALATRARIIMFDNSSRGLDASTALEFVRALRIATNVSRSTTVSSVYQAGENLAMTFDKVIVLTHGHCVYFGPISRGAEYFKSIGFLPHDRQTTPDFLISCTDPVARRVNPAFERVPLAPAEMAAAFRESSFGKANREEVDAYMAEMEARMGKEQMKQHVVQTRAERTRHVRMRSPYILSWPQQLRLAIKRRMQIAWGERSITIVMTSASLFQALIMGSVFYQMPDVTNALFSRSGIIFFSLLYNSFSAMAEVPNSYAQRPIVIRQQHFAMLHPSADSLGVTLLDIPVRAVTLTVFIIVIYFMTGLSVDAGKFFIFYFTVMLITYTMVGFFRMLTALTRSVAAATMVAGLVIIDCALYAGYAIPRPSMVVWWRWLSYCNPIAFGFEVLLANEFRGKTVDCAQLVPAGPSYMNVPLANKVCPIAGARPGEARINASDYIRISYGYTWANTNRNIGIIIGFWIFFLICYMVASEFQTDPAASGGVMVFKRTRKLSQSEIEKDAAKTDVVAPEKTVADPSVERGQSDGLPTTLDVSDEVFSWRNVNFDIFIKGKPRRLLTDVSGFVPPGKMTALMGESGAGKTTLLNVLAQRTDVGVVQGDFFVNGRPLPRSFQADTGYCQQQDVHMAQLTVRESLQFSALLRQPRETPKEERLAYVETVLDLLEMNTFADALVGEETEGLSVEQRKRLTIGVELAAKPSLLLFLDEPTSGLDGQAAWSIVHFLKKLAAEGQAILCTIHQPSGELFNQFDRLLLLQKGGKTVYFGELGENSMTLIDYFESRSGVKCGENANPAEYILDMIGAGATATTDKDWFQLYRESPHYAEMQKQLEAAEARGKGDVATTKSTSRLNREYAQPFFVQFAVTTWRMFIAYWRSPVYVLSKLFLNVFAGLFIGSSFWGQGQKVSQAALQNKLFATFMALVISTSLSQQLQPMFLTQRDLFETRERPSKLYRWPIFLLAQAIVEIPWNLLGGTLFWVCWYFMVQFGNEGTRAGYSWGLYMLFQLYFASFAQATATVSPNALIASILFSTFFSFVIVFCGVVQPPPQMPYFWRSWMFRLSPFTWIIEGMLGNAIFDKPVRCTDVELNSIVPPSGMSCEQYLKNFSSTLAQPAVPGAGYYEPAPDGTCSFCAMREGEDYMDSILLDSSRRFRDLGFLVAYIAFNFFLYFALYYLFRIHRWKREKPSKISNAAPLETESSSAAESKKEGSI
ncbi:hypothetical protein MSPP1_000931 [Malassezia sp. CBS 17886]|nr:hypothetical protein MSPP1_000931 [Malassezia sp. CBS 17886]